MLRPIVKLRLVAIILSAAFLISCSRFSAHDDSGAAIPKDFLEAATKVLGPDAQVAKYGHLIGAKSMEVVAYTKLGITRKYSEGIAVSKLVVLQKADSQWDVILNASKQVVNPFGYMGLDLIDDSQDYPGWLVSFYDYRPDNVPGFSMSFMYLRSDGDVEGIPIEISWNSTMARFQEFVVNEAPEGFRSEIKNPPRRK
jgi:hypothetical protein